MYVPSVDGYSIFLGTLLVLTPCNDRTNTTVTGYILWQLRNRCPQMISALVY